MTVYPSLAGRAVFITGGATGIGAAFVEAFARQGMTVGFIDINQEAGEDLCASIEERDMPSPWFQPVDVTDVPELKKSVSAFAEKAGRLDVLVSNVANDMRQPALEVEEDDWRQCMAVNLDAAFFAVQAALPLMQAGGGGSIIILSSINPLFGPPNMTSYSTAKAGLLGMTKTLSNEFGKDNIRVNTILPGWVLTERQRQLWYTPEEAEKWKESVALKKDILPSDIARLALFLAADDSEMITGQKFIIDTGRI